MKALQIIKKVYFLVCTEYRDDIFWILIYKCKYGIFWYWHAIICWMIHAVFIDWYWLDGALQHVMFELVTYNVCISWLNMHNDMK